MTHGRHPGSKKWRSSDSCDWLGVSRTDLSTADAGAEPDDKIAAYLETARPQLEEAAHNDRAAKAALEECLQLAPAVGTGQSEDTADGR